jgi:hypothetical protein
MAGRKRRFPKKGAERKRTATRKSLKLGRYGKLPTQDLSNCWEGRDNARKKSKESVIDAKP